MRPRFPSVAFVVFAGLLAACAADANGDDAEDSSTNPAASEEALANGGPKLVVERSILGITPGMSAIEIRQHLGAPSGTGQFEGPGGPANPPDTNYEYGHTDFWMHYRQGVYRIETASKNVRTAGGLGVGSTEKEIEAQLDVSCTSYVDIDDSTVRECMVGHQRKGEITTIFELRGGHTSLVTLERW
jgi:hypothetical protein